LLGQDAALPVPLQRPFDANEYGASRFAEASGYQHGGNGDIYPHNRICN
jgi:hypothetical protein